MLLAVQRPPIVAYTPAGYHPPALLSVAPKRVPADRAEASTVGQTMPARQVITPGETVQEEPPMQAFLDAIVKDIAMHRRPERTSVSGDGKHCRLDTTSHTSWQYAS